MDIQYAKEQFERYLDRYDRENDKVKLKIIHTYGVVECSRQITERMGLKKEDQELAQIIALLHDIGRFEQLKRFDSFEPTTMDHAAFGVQILFDENMIREFVTDHRWDDIIRTAIARHSDFKLDGIKDERELLHARIIRDADKLDNCRVKLEDSVETILGVSAKEVGMTKITPEVLEQIMRKESVLSSTRRTKMDYWVSYLAYFFDINFKETMSIIWEKRYVQRIIEKIPYAEPETKEEMDKIKTMLLEYIRSEICAGGRPTDSKGREEKELKVYDLLDSLEIPYIRTDHKAVGTIADCLEVDRVLGVEICKNLFLCNRQKTAYYLLLVPGNKALKTKELSKQIPTSRLSFASGEDMERYLNVSPGSATIMGLIFDPENKVQLLVDEELLDKEYFGCHPCVNTSSLKLRTKDVLGKFLKAVGHDYITVKLSDGNSDKKQESVGI